MSKSPKSVGFIRTMILLSFFRDIKTSLPLPWRLFRIKGVALERTTVLLCCSLLFLQQMLASAVPSKVEVRKSPDSDFVLGLTGIVRTHVCQVIDEHVDIATFIVDHDDLSLTFYNAVLLMAQRLHHLSSCFAGGILTLVGRHFDECRYYDSLSHNSVRCRAPERSEPTKG
jgi:hypothetical protein